LLLRIPTEQEIAAMLRHRTIGAVLVDICADLGIGLSHPMWQEVKYLVVKHGGRWLPVINRTSNRLNAARREVLAGIAPDWTLYYDTGPEPDATGPPPNPAV
jgi:hypothetical protein